MATIYCDYAAGNDTTGDGSAGNPYKTIDKASTGLVGPNSIRCAKSPDHVALSGTLAFVNGSASINTSADLRSEISVFDLVGKNESDEGWWEVTAVTSTKITISRAYWGTTETVPGYKAGVTDTGAAAASTTAVQSLLSQGGSNTFRLVITGGWDLSGTPAQTGHTFFWQSGANRNGYGLVIDDKDYISVTGPEIGFFRYNYGIMYKGDSYFAKISYVHLAGNYCGISTNSARGLYIEYCRINGNSNWGINDTSSSSMGVYYCEIVSNGAYGIYITVAGANTGIGNNHFDGNVQGIYVNGTRDVYINDNTFENHTGVGSVYITASSVYASRNTFANNVRVWRMENGAMITSYCTVHDHADPSEVGFFSAYSGNSCRVISISENPDTDNYNRTYFYGGYIEKDTVNSRSGACVAMICHDLSYDTDAEFYVPVQANTARTVKVWIKEDGNMDYPDIYLSAWYEGALVSDWVEVIPTTSYVEYSCPILASAIPRDGVVQIIAMGYGINGKMFFDDLTYE